MTAQHSQPAVELNASEKESEKCIKKPQINAILIHCHGNKYNDDNDDSEVHLPSTRSFI
jgi:hypothetical protein